MTTVSVTPSGDFVQTNNCITSLAPGASCTIGATFRLTIADRAVVSSGNLPDTLHIDQDAVIYIGTLAAGQEIGRGEPGRARVEDARGPTTRP